MLLALLGALALAPPYWLLVPAAWRRAVATVASLLALGLLDLRLPALGAATAAGLWAAGRLRRPQLAVLAGLGALCVLFVWNKQAGGGLTGPLPTQGSLALLGVSFLVLKAAAVLLDIRRGVLEGPRFGELLGWLAYAPTFPAGPIERFQHFRPQQPTWSSVRVSGGLQRILFGAVKSLVVGQQLALWAAPVLAKPELSSRVALLAGLWAVGLRFYLDFAGYSDIAIGLGAVFGIEIEENFNLPFLRRNLVLLWQHWHMTLTRWLREYLFVPTSHALLRRARWLGDRPALALAQIVTMTFCGLWHGLAWHFARWGFLQAVGFVWVGLMARELGRLLPPGLVAWWRRNPAGTVVSTLLTVQYFVATLVFVVADVPRGVALLRLLLLP
jgi:alginate O-acetyltransferase complex protein AlgI